MEELLRSYMRGMLLGELPLDVEKDAENARTMLLIWSCACSNFFDTCSGAFENWGQLGSNDDPCSDSLHDHDIKCNGIRQVIKGRTQDSRFHQIKTEFLSLTLNIHPIHHLNGRIVQSQAPSQSPQVNKVPPLVSTTVPVIFRSLRT